MSLGNRVAGLMLASCLSLPAFADAAAPKIDKVWAPPGDKGIDLPIYMTVNNSGDADHIVRFGCPDMAHFTEKRTTDHGEGAPSAREIKTIPIKAGGTTMLEPDGYHLALLKIMKPAKAGDTFNCKVAFQRSGTKEIEVRVVVAKPD